MKATKSLILFLYRHNAIRYLFVGGTTFLIDLGLLVLLHGVIDLHLGLSATLAYWLSILWNFTLNRWWTFSASESKKLHKHISSYLLLLGFNYVFTVTFIYILTSMGLHYSITKVIVVCVQISWTYPIYKYVIFNKE